LLRVAMRLSPEARVDENGRAKALLRDAAAPHLPPAVRDRKDKMGFPLPIRDWFAGPWKERAREILLDRSTIERGLVEAITATGQARYDRRLYSALLFELWAREYLDR
ncbi:MAG: asparagine synthase-related protein, partial [Planctomycetota bacterium]|jgi:asparagine synthase (glutamine-hydrolysing)